MSHFRVGFTEVWGGRLGPGLKVLQGRPIRHDQQGPVEETALALHLFLVSDLQLLVRLPFMECFFRIPLLFICLSLLPFESFEEALLFIPFLFYLPVLLPPSLLKFL